MEKRRKIYLKGREEYHFLTDVQLMEKCIQEEIQREKKIILCLSSS